MMALPGRAGGRGGESNAATYYQAAAALSSGVIRPGATLARLPDFGELGAGEHDPADIGI